MGWLVAAAIIVGIGFIRLGVSVHYDESGLVIKILAGFFRFTIVPLPRKKQQKEKKPDGKPQNVKTSTDAAPQTRASSQGGSLQDFYPLIQIGLRFMNQFRKKLCVNNLVLVLTLGGDDPCDLAINYGRAWAALGNLVPTLERYFNIHKRNFEVQCDFTSQQTRIQTQADLTLTVHQLVQMGAVYGYLFVREFINFKKKRKGGTES